MLLDKSNKSNGISASNTDVSISNRSTSSATSTLLTLHNDTATVGASESWNEKPKEQLQQHPEENSRVSDLESTSETGTSGRDPSTEIFPANTSQRRSPLELSEKNTGISKPKSKSKSKHNSERPTLSNRRGESHDKVGNSYPEGGLEAWLCVIGAFCGLTAALGIMNSMGIIQSYLSSNQLRSTNEQTIAWIFGIYSFLTFFCGVQIGPIFDAKGPRWLVLTGSFLILLMWFVLGLCTTYWQFMLAFGVCGGLGTSLLFSPCVAAIGHFFLEGRGLWTGVASAGGALGGIIFPLVLQVLFPKVGFAWSTRIIGFISLALLVIANLFLRARLPPKKATLRSILPDVTIFRDPVYAITTLGGFCVEWSLNVPLTFLASYGIHKGLDINLAYQLIVYINVGSVFGRILPGMLADKIGRFNTMILTAGLCLVANLAIWLPAGTSVPALIVYALVFGFASGSGIGLMPVCVSQLCAIEHYGRYYATCYSFMSIATLTGIPISGALITAVQGEYWAAIVFTGCTYGVGMALFIVARVMRVGWGFKAVF